MGICDSLVANLTSSVPILTFLGEDILWRDEDVLMIFLIISPFRKMQTCMILAMEGRKNCHWNTT